MPNVILCVTSFACAVLHGRGSIITISPNVEAALRSPICSYNVPAEVHNCVTAGKALGITLPRGKGGDRDITAAFHAAGNSRF